MKQAMKIFIALIAFTGVIRFVLTTAGVSNDVVKYASMTIVIMAGSLYFGATTSTHKDRLKAAYLLILPYMVVEVATLSFTWSTGRPTIFHAPEYSMGTGIAVHTLGHLAGGLTWEPLMVFIVMEIVWAIAWSGRWVRAHAIG
jgi:hypothetical protein